MTPLVCEMVANTPDAEDFMWFDVGQKPTEPIEFQYQPENLIHLPFPKVAIVGYDAGREKFVLCCIQGDGHVTVAGFFGTGASFTPIHPFQYVDTPEGLRLMPPTEGEPRPSQRDCIGAIAIISAFTQSLDKTVNAYSPKVKANSLVNKKRIAKGKPALVYDWTTVVIEPSKPKSEPLGGTHASPRQHDRRGYWRTSPKGKRHWVKNTVVGDASKGAVFKDYEVKI